MMLLGRCRKCGKNISIRYPAVEILTAACLFLLMALYGISWRALADFIFLSLLIVIAFIDMENLVIPDILVMIGILTGVIFNSLAGEGMVFSVVGLAGGFVIMWLFGFTGKILFKKDALGEGDIKLAAMLGAYLGLNGAVVSFFLASIIGSLIAAPLLMLKIMKRDDLIPYGSLLAVGALVSLFFSAKILEFIGF